MRNIKRKFILSELSYRARARALAKINEKKKTNPRARASAEEEEKLESDRQDWRPSVCKFTTNSERALQAISLSQCADLQIKLTTQSSSSSSFSLNRFHFLIETFRTIQGHSHSQTRARTPRLVATCKLQFNGRHKICVCARVTGQ